MDQTQPATASPRASRPFPRWLQIVIFGRNLRWTLIRVAILVVVSVVVFTFVLIPIHVEGPSMLPTYKNGGVNFVNRLAYRSHEPERGDVVAIRFAGKSIMLMKRIVAKPGETIAFTNGVIYINNEPLPEPYVKLPTHWNRLPQTVAADEFFVVGDNRSMRLELHDHGAVKRWRIIGKVLL